MSSEASKVPKTWSQANVVSIYKHQWHAYKSYTCYKHIYRNICICISQQTTDSSDRWCIFYVSCNINPPHCSTDCFLKINTWHIGTGVPHASGLFAAFFLKIQPHRLWKSSSDQHWFTDWLTEILLIFFGICNDIRGLSSLSFSPRVQPGPTELQKNREHWGAALHSRSKARLALDSGFTGSMADGETSWYLIMSSQLPACKSCS